METEMPEVSLRDIPVVQELPDVYSEKIPGMPPPREVEFCIDLIPGVTPDLGPHIGWHRWNLKR